MTDRCLSRRKGINKTSMRFKAKVNVVVAGGTRIPAGMVVDAKTVAHLDPNDFERVADAKNEAKKAAAPAAGKKTAGKAKKGK